MWWLMSILVRQRQGDHMFKFSLSYIAIARPSLVLWNLCLKKQANKNKNWDVDRKEAELRKAVGPGSLSLWYSEYVSLLGPFVSSLL